MPLDSWSFVTIEPVGWSVCAEGSASPSGAPPRSPRRGAEGPAGLAKLVTANQQRTGMSLGLVRKQKTRQRLANGSLFNLENLSVPRHRGFSVHDFSSVTNGSLKVNLVRSFLSAGLEQRSHRPESEQQGPTLDKARRQCRSSSRYRSVRVASHRRRSLLPWGEHCQTLSSRREFPAKLGLAERLKFAGKIPA